jgi:hypothetical protein
MGYLYLIAAFLFAASVQWYSAPTSAEKLATDMVLMNPNLPLDHKCNVAVVRADLPKLESMGLLKLSEACLEDVARAVATCESAGLPNCEALTRPAP